MGCSTETTPARCCKEKAFVVRIIVAPRYCASFKPPRAACTHLASVCKRPLTHRANFCASLQDACPTEPGVRMPRRSLGAGFIDVAPHHAVNPSPPFDFDYTPCWPYIVAGLGPDDERPAESFGFSHVAVRFDKRGELCVRDCNVANAEGPDTLFLDQAFRVVKYDGTIGTQKKPCRPVFWLKAAGYWHDAEDAVALDAAQNIVGPTEGQHSRFVDSDIFQGVHERLVNADIGCPHSANGGWNRLPPILAPCCHLQLPRSLQIPDIS